ncbi:MAG TPA: twin-arginine translocase TatA/TatE family subunit [Candidatus Limnocylindrales bacterium]|nr:twin-arginine translocase TatA/TatE family subunit [Candidatus Limnocylindrales bacterium]
MPLPSGFEWIVILVIALLILGPGKLPDVASAVGKSIREFRKASSDVQEAVRVDTSPAPAQPAATPPAEPAAPPPVAATTQPPTQPLSAAPSPAEPTGEPNR